MDKTLKLAPLDASNLAASVALFIDTFTQAPWYDKFESTKQVETFFENHLANNYFVGYVLYTGEAVIALSLGFKKPWINGMEYYIDQFCVGIPYQGQGIGSQFMQLIEADISRKSLGAIILNTEAGYPAEQFYLKNGFEVLKGLMTLAK